MMRLTHFLVVLVLTFSAGFAIHYLGPSSLSPAGGVVSSLVHLPVAPSSLARFSDSLESQPVLLSTSSSLESTMPIFKIGGETPSVLLVDPSSLTNEITRSTDMIPGSYIGCVAETPIPSMRVAPASRVEAVAAHVNAVSQKLFPNRTDELDCLIEIRFNPTYENNEYVRNELPEFTPNRLYPITQVPPGGTPIIIDPLFSSQWFHPKLHSKAAWQKTQGSASTVIAVIDSGVDYRHVDLSSNIWANPGEIPSNGIDDEGNGYVDDVHGWDFVNLSFCPVVGEDCFANDNDPSDFVGHGTHVAGIIAAPANGIGVAGVCPKCTIMPIRTGFAYPGGGTLSESMIAQGLVYAADNGADVINMSFGSAYYSPIIKTAVSYAQSKGVVLVGAAGNANTNVPFYPAAFSGVISVSALTQNDQRAIFSNYGSTVDVAAPGVSILSTVPENGYYSSDTNPPLPTNPKYAYFSGTSMASPMIAGMAGLIISLTPTVSTNVVQTAIQTGADPFSTLHTMEGGPYIGTGRGRSDHSLTAIQTDSSAVLLVNDDLLSPPLTGNQSIMGTVTSTLFSSGSIDVLSHIYDDTPSIDESFIISQPVTNDILASVDTTRIPNGEKIIRVQLKNAAGAIIARVEKPITFANVEIKNPTPHAPVSLQSTIPIYGTVQGTGMIKYELGYRYDVTQPFLSNGFVYNGNTTPKTNALLATWTPSTIPTHSQLFQLQVTVFYPGNVTIPSVFDYYYDADIRAGFPITIPTPGSITIRPDVITQWDASNNQHPLLATAFSRFDTAPPTNKLFVYTGTGSSPPGWPYTFPTTQVVNNHTYAVQLLLSNTLTTMDVDQDGKEELLASVFATDTTSGAQPYQALVYAFNENGTIATGFPIAPNLPAPSTIQFFTIFDTSLMVADMTNDGLMDIVQNTITGYPVTTGGNTETYFTVFVQNVGGTFTPNSFKIGEPSAPGIIQDYAPTPMAIANLDADPENEIIFRVMTISGSPPIIHTTLEAVNNDGTLVTGWPKQLVINGSSNVVVSGITTGIMNGATIIALSGGFTDQVVGASYSFVNLIDASGNSLPGYPIARASPMISPSTVFAEKNGTLPHELVIQNAASIDIRDVSGNMIAGWPKATYASSLFSPIIVQQGSDVDVLVTHTDDQLLSIYSTPAPVSIWTKKVSGKPIGPPGITDLGNDGIYDIFAATYCAFASAPIEEPPLYGLECVANESRIYAWDNTPFAPGTWSDYRKDNHRTSMD